MSPVINVAFWGIIKWFVVFAIGLYVIFAFVIIKQVKVMIATLEVGFETPLKYFAYFHFLFSIGVLLIAFLVL